MILLRCLRLPCAIGGMIGAMVTAQVVPCEAQTPPRCGDPAALYALRANTPADWTRLLHLHRLSRPDPNEPDAPPRLFWQVSLVRVWPARGETCAQAVVLAEQMANHDRTGPTPVRTRPIVLTVRPGAPAGTYATQDVPATDWRFLADPRVPDLDGDGIPEHLVMATGPADSVAHGSELSAAPELCATRSSINSCAGCGLPNGTSVTLVSSHGTTLAGPVFLEGRTPDLALDTRIHTALVNWQRANNSAPENQRDELACPRPVPRYDTFVRDAEVFVRMGPDRATLEWRGRPSHCVGWDESRQTDGHYTQATCHPAPPILRTVSVAPGTSTVEDTPLPADARVEVRTACTDCALSAIPWTLPDGLREPHRIPVHATPDEVRTAHATHETAGHPLRLHPGEWLVQSVAPSVGTTTYQVVIGPGDHEPVTLPP